MLLVAIKIAAALIVVAFLVYLITFVWVWWCVRDFIDDDNFWR